MPRPSQPVSPAGALVSRDALYLIDTMGYIFRAFHALPPLSTAGGLPTQAVLGFVNMLRKLMAEMQPRAMAAVFDVAGPTFRDERFASYKAQRAPMPETLAPQIPYIRRALEAFRVPVLEAAGFEADDVLGTLARQAAAEGDVVIVSSDKDLLQLVDERVRVYNPSRDQWLDAAAVEAKLGVPPAQVADLLALRGDAVDNIPGAPGIGEKGAQQLITRFGSVEAALDHAQEVERKTYRESLLNHREQILLSKTLATIDTHAPVSCDASAWAVQGPDLEACRALFTELEFHHLRQSLEAEAASQAPDNPTPGAPELATRAATAAELEEFLRQTAASPVAVAVWEGKIGLASGETSWLVDEERRAVLRAALADPARTWQWHDSRVVRTALRELGLERPRLDPGHVEDATLLAYLADPTRASYGLDPADAAADAGQQAAAAAGEIARLRRSRGFETPGRGLWRVYNELDLPLLPVLEAMEDTGVRVDPAPLALLSAELEQRCQTCQEQVFALAGTRFNLGSPQQLAEVLYHHLGLPAPPRRGKTKSLSTAVDVLEELAVAHEVVRPILEFRQLSKLKSTYVDALPPLIRPSTGRVHTTFNLAGSATGRLSSSNPNLQNIPVRSEIGRQIRAAFVPDPGHVLLAADYSQIELRLLAHFSQDPRLLAAYRGGEDIHQLTASEVFGVPPLLVDAEHRRRAKAVNFGIVYGLSAFGLSKQLGIPQAEAARFIQRYFERYAGVRAYVDRCLDEARRNGRVETLFGRVRPIPNLDARNAALRGFAERTAINSPLQGTAADLIKLAMIRLHPQLAALDAVLLLQVHDELLLEAPPAAVPALARLVRKEMEQVAELSVPLRVEIGVGPNWRDLEERPAESDA